MGLKTRIRGLLNVDDPKETKVPSALLESERGYSRLMPCNVIGGETIEKTSRVFWGKQENQSIYTGEPPAILEFDTKLIPSRRRLFILKRYPKVVRLRLYHKLYDEPMTRELYSYSFLNPAKKRKVLVEKGIIDEEGFLLEWIQETIDGVVVTKKKRKVINHVFVKPDVSDIDFIKAEFHALFQSKGIEKVAQSMNKTGQSFDKWYYITLIGAFVFGVLVVFIMSGGF